MTVASQESHNYCDLFALPFITQQINGIGRVSAGSKGPSGL